MIVPTTARLIVREHLYHPLAGQSVLLLGRQTMSMDLERCLTVLKEEGYEPPAPAVATVAQESRDQETRYGKDRGFLRDASFFQLLGVAETRAMDVSTYEGCDIVHDLNMPVPAELQGRFDFIVDGGTFDHLFDIRTAFQNVVEMLKPGGRILQWNAASQFTGLAYLSFGPDFFYDFYTLNQFADCQVYIAEVDDIGQHNNWDFYQFTGEAHYENFRSDRFQMVVVLAEKGSESTAERMPIQAQYRDAALQAAYAEGQHRIQQSKRKPWMGVRAPAVLTEKRRSSWWGGKQIEQALPVSRVRLKAGFEYRGRI